jgi:two-component system chemotaxis response regulator CheV
MHTSLSSSGNGAVGRSAAVDAYITKFEPIALAATLRPMLRARAGAGLACAS